ncbi:8-amino-7-oxononanoate synthase [Streptantibioticus cattleyicolor]|uniref:8-amino-7-oxononanoate synthase n=1 Tax=Streptantibioticus cattleyicolor (strain ATCC 35852 / DSM 46488 / JCM 4925 / NBRC 14057 / NRRL 8057) TaxID=1003195 RepID=F8JJV8_STREN|nr:8-amino-7-oxononanoate synthase [Streptantibioticus cattleyicolor]AEW98616.1 8-amino-7-oxononanoate synthase [Streptantibioticus cattleyicolor NRRL 8057 = DSM 46488]CCB72325.1 8-amino-7-oxononanoate synthase [Streptantibioticus cattleyicolor NRRL 8057 = DSM 46488]
MRGEAVFDWLADTARRRERAGLRRTARARGPVGSGVNLSGNDYLGLARHPEVCAAAAEACRVWGAGSTGSRLVTGTTALHEELEERLARFCGTEAALVFSSGYLANVGALTALCRPGSLVVMDGHAHASLIDGGRLSGAAVAETAHGELAAVEDVLARRRQRRAVVVTESVFSVDGDAADLAGLLGVARRHGAALLVDEAHALGVVGERGRGALAGAGLAGETDVVMTTTLSKALGAQGGAVLGSRRVVEHVLNSARSFLFDTGLAPGCAGGALAALRLLEREPGRAVRVREVAARLREGLAAAGLTVTAGGAAVVSVRAESARAAVAWQENCRAAGVEVSCFRPPSVPDRFSRLRLTARADLTDEEVARAVSVIAAARPDD